MMKEMSIDLETYSDVNITKCGAYKYAESDEFEILLFGVSVDGGPVTVYDLACGDTIPEEILAALSDENVTKWAFNASFERICLQLAEKASPGILHWLQHPGGSRRSVPESGILEMHHDLVSLHGTAAVTGRCRSRPEAAGSEAEGRQRPDPLLLQSLQTDQKQWQTHSEPSGTQSGEVVTLQILQ